MPDTITSYTVLYIQLLVHAKNFNAIRFVIVASIRFHPATMPRDKVLDPSAITNEHQVLFKVRRSSF